MVPGWRQADGTQARLDVAYLVDGSTKHVDVMVRHSAAAKYLQRAAVMDGAAASVAKASKR
eukprot:10540526-Karenia_brevis.AAC.1